MVKNKILVIIAIAISLSAILYIIAGIVETFTYHNSADFAKCNQYIGLFKDNLKNGKNSPGIIHPHHIYNYSKQKIGAFFCASNTFFYFDFLDKVIYEIKIIEIKELNNIDLNKITIKHRVDFNEEKNISKIFFNKNSSSMNINLDDFSKINGTFSKANYKGFYGVVNKMSFSNKKQEHIIVFDNSDIPEKVTAFNTMFPLKNYESQTLLLLYKGHQSFYAIIIRSFGAPFKNSSIINLFNLK